MADAVEHLLECLFVIRRPLWWSVCSRLCPFLSCLFSYCWVLRALYIKVQFYCMGRGGENRGEIKDTSFPLPERNQGEKRGKREAETELQIGFYSPPTRKLQNNHTYCFIICQFQPRFILHCPFTEIDGWGKKRNYYTYRPSSVVASQSHPSISPSTHPPSHPASPPGEPSAALSRICFCVEAMTSNLQKSSFKVRIGWELHLLVLTAPFHPPHSASPKHPPPGSSFTNKIMWPSCLYSLHCLLSDLRRAAKLLTVACLVL